VTLLQAGDGGDDVEPEETQTIAPDYFGGEEFSFKSRK
jgi:hypothetical protein